MGILLRHRRGRGGTPLMSRKLGEGPSGRIGGGGVISYLSKGDYINKHVSKWQPDNYISGVV